MSVSCYDNPHLMPVTQCATNLYSWDDTITQDVTQVRAVHVTELRTAINEELTRRGLDTLTWEDTITANSTLIRKQHVDELRDAITTLKTGDCPTDSYYCPEDTSGCVDGWDTIVAGTTQVRAEHFNQMRTIVNGLRTTCICETEQCQYCSDCGYRTSSCPSNRPCYCDNSKYATGCNPQVSIYNCGSINTGGMSPYKTFPGSIPQDGYVPWAMCAYAPGSNWSAYWTCKCSPFTW